MIEWWEERRYLVDKLIVCFQGSQYEGRGTMTWRPDKGFEVDARVTRHGPPLPAKRVYGPSLIGAEDRRTIRMTLQGGEKVLIPGLPMARNYDINELGDLHIRAARAVFCESPRERFRFARWYGRALIETGELIHLPDPVDTEVKIWSEIVTGSHSIGGLRHIDADLDATAWHPRDGFLKLSWSLDPRYWSRAEAWRWPEAAEIGLSILCGKRLRLVEREVSRGRRTFLEVRKSDEITDLSFLSPIQSQPLLPRTDVVELISFLAGSSVESNVCGRILWQLAEARRQQTTQGTALLCSTILEAALRTLDRRSFVPGDRSWLLQQSLKRFREKYLTHEWKDPCEKVLEAYRELRHRNAHPDWLTVAPGQMTKESVARALDGLRILARFYGYMILALSGRRDLTPDFPESLSRPRTLLTVSSENGRECPAERPPFKATQPVKQW